MKIKTIIISVLFLMLSNIAKSEFIDPVLFLKNIIEECKPILAKKNDDFIEKKITEYIDFNEMSIWIVGKSIWLNTKEDKKKEFIYELKKLITKTYTKTVYYYIDTDVNFNVPKNQNFKTAGSNKRIQLYSTMKKNNTIVNIDYRLIKHENSWLVYDIIIEGVSILKSFKIQFHEIIKSKGIDVIIEKMAEINKS
ncbi:MAG TPA: ABC transporter substrate-binding protein [Candidatus Azoamicus sp. OHIO1]